MALSSRSFYNDHSGKCFKASLISQKISETTISLLLLLDTAFVKRLGYKIPL